MIGDDPKLHELIAEESENLRIARQVFELRTAAGLSQLQLARKINTTRAVISRLEAADYEGHSLAMLQRITTVLNNRRKSDKDIETRKPNHMKAISYKKDLLKQLKDPEYAQAYLEQTVATGDRAATQLAINDVIEANATKKNTAGLLTFSTKHLPA
jgi:transcriptional regulator with XRE-family HTH domain